MHVGFKVKLGIFHVKSDSPAERRRKRAAKRKRRDARLKRRQARRQRLQKWIERRATARWSQRVREPVVASTQPRAVRDDGKARQRADRVAAAHADAARVTGRTQSARADVVHGPKGPAPTHTASGVPLRQATQPEYMEMSKEQRADYARLPRSVTGGTFRQVQSEGKTEDEWRREAFPDGHPSTWPTAPQNAHGQTVPTDTAGWPTGTDQWTARIDDLNRRGDEARDRRTQDARAAGLCGAPTQKDRSPCLNHAGSCPHHRRVLA